MKFALVMNGAVVEYREYPEIPDCKHIDGLPTIRPVVDLPPPTFDPMTQTLVRTATVFDDRVEWSYGVEALPAEQVTANLQSATDSAELAEVKLDNFVRSFIAMTPTQVSSYVDANVTDLTSAKVLLRRMAVMLLYLAKRAYR